ncbi:MAG: hypothetical protein AB7V50_03150 [Vampirovibrionia bacterium]
MIVLYIYLALAFTWSVYNAIINVPAYCKLNPSTGPTEKTMIYIMSIIAGTVIAPYSFYKKVLQKGGKKNGKLDK